MMKLDKGLILASLAAVLVVGAVGGSVLSLKKAETEAGELADARRSISEQLRASKRLNAELATKLARTDAQVYGLAQGFAELENHRTTSTTEDPGSDAETGDTPAPPEAAETAEHSQQEREAIQHADALVANATQAGRWTEQDRDRLHELLDQVDGRERMRIETSVGMLLVERKLVADEGFVPL